MQLSNRAITDFKKIYQKKFGVDLNDDDANEKGVELLNLFRLVYRPIPKKALMEMKNLMFNAYGNTNTNPTK